jgi:hypothetical protein
MFKCFWLTSKSVDQEWDKLLNLLIDKGEVTDISPYTITFDNKYEVWISNHPFSSGHLYDYKGNSREIVSGCHCSRNTKIRLEDFYYALRSKEMNFEKEIERYSSM